MYRGDFVDKGKDCNYNGVIMQGQVKYMSKTKRNIDEETLAVIFRKHNLGEIKEVTPLKGGMFNSVLKITVTSGKSYVIKIAPPDDISVLTYEKNLIKSEAFFYKEFASLSKIKVPEIYGCDYDENSDYRYLIMEFIDGEMLNCVKLSKSEESQLMFALGCAMAEIHNLPCEYGFGYLQNGLYDSWDKAYLTMVENVIENAQTKKAKIPYLDELREIFRENAQLLKTVEKPCFNHFDLWAGNIMIKDNKLYAFIDCERAMIGDRMGDFISLDYLAGFDKEENKDLIAGYNSVAREPLYFDKDEMKRFYLMKIYLGLIVYTEQHYRYSRFSPVFYSGKAFGKKVVANAISNLRKLG